MKREASALLHSGWTREFRHAHVSLPELHLQKVVFFYFWCSGNVRFPDWTREVRRLQASLRWSDLECSHVHVCSASAGQTQTEPVDSPEVMHIYIREQAVGGCAS